MNSLDNTSRKQSGHRFKKGVSGNPKGRPLGAKNKSSVIAESLLVGQSEALVQKAVRMALSGNITALKLCLERIIPVKREPTVLDVTEKKQDELPRDMRIDLSDLTDEELALLTKMRIKIESELGKTGRKMAVIPRPVNLHYSYKTSVH